jgi:dephospho-CoA kinase
VLTIGLTGGIASGKSTVARMFVEFGATLVDTDIVAREVVAPGTPGLRAVTDAFGASILAATGELDRRRMRAIIFTDAGKRSRLEAILHPRIRAATLEQMQMARGPYLIVAVPLLVETDFSQLVDRVLVVTCERNQQIERLMGRDNVTREQAEAMLAAQTDDSARLDAADDVIDNSAAASVTRAQVYRLHKKYLSSGDYCRIERRRAE